MAQKFIFQVDGRPGAPIRDKWIDAATDAVQAGFAVFTQRSEDGEYGAIRIDEQAEIIRITVQ